MIIQRSLKNMMQHKIIAHCETNHQKLICQDTNKLGLRYYKDHLQPGDILLYSVASQYRKPDRIQDILIPFAQNLFLYDLEHDISDESHITHAAIYLGDGKIAEMYRFGYGEKPLHWTFWHHNENNESIFKFRAMHCFRPTCQKFKAYLLNNATFETIENDLNLSNPNPNHKRYNIEYDWLGTIGALFHFFKKKGTTLREKVEANKDEKRYSTKEHCASFIVKLLKKTAMRLYKEGNEHEKTLAELYYPKDLYSNSAPCILSRYLKSQCDTTLDNNPLFEHHVLLDINPYEQLKRLVTRDILPRLDVLGAHTYRFANEMARTKRDLLREAFDQSTLRLDQAVDTDPYTKAQALYDDIKDSLQLYRSSNKNKQPTQSNKTTSYLMARQLMEKNEHYRDTLSPKFK